MSDKRDKRFARGYAQGYTEGFRDGFRAGFDEARGIAIGMFGPDDDMMDLDDLNAICAEALEDEEALGVDEAFWAGEDEADDDQDGPDSPEGTTGTEVGL